MCKLRGQRKGLVPFLNLLLFLNTYTEKKKDFQYIKTKTIYKIVR